MTMKKKTAVILRGYKVLNGLIPGYLPVATVKAVFSALLPFINIFMSARIINAIAGGQSLKQVLTLAFITAGADFITMIVMSVTQRVGNYLSSGIWRTEEKPLDEKQREMDFEYIEDPETRLTRQKLHTYRNTGGNGIASLFWNFEHLINFLFTIIFSISMFVTAFNPVKTAFSGKWLFINTPWFSALLLLIILGNAVLGLLLASKNVKEIFSVFGEMHFANALGNFLFFNLCEKYQMGKDMKIYKLNKSLGHQMDDILAIFGGICDKWAKIETRYNNYASIRSNILSAVAYIFVAVKAVVGSLGAGMIVQYVGGITKFNDGLSGFAAQIGQIFANVDALNIYFGLLDMPDKVYHGTIPVEKRDDNEYEIEFCDVSFKYPGTDAYALRNFSFKLYVGQRVAVVGMNGSGKTTMIKLLCRLYDPTEGEITLNGIDIRKYDYNEYMNLFSVVFQDFKLFSFPLGQNVAASMDVDNNKARRSLEMAGFADRLTTLTDGLDTPLYKDFDENGVEISGGEAQKIALARALYKGAPFIVLDEPTAALDPAAEFDVYSRFNEIVGGKTAVYISHRLSSCRFCDDIAVFHEGRLIQRGSHDALLADGNGKYAELWHAQAQYYNSQENGEAVDSPVTSFAV